ncbi:MAG: nucleotidyl transferase AbiEii/AbiGii toxin family protein [Deltaproteobacteria bacterium]|nr:nucleotidyl transferase AbiEii/AbiGii toxin family protein [Deltaproteobacteria bacterium]
MNAPIQMHEDPLLFREDMNFTATQTRFLPRLIEKDYFCTLLLNYLAAADATLIFKGGTCLAKVHAEFYRLSEDLDFVIPAPCDAPRSQRRALATRLKEAAGRIEADLKPFRIVEPLRGANNSTQYVACIGYQSLLSGQEETIKIEVGLREPLLMPVSNSMARTLLLNPISGQPMVPAFPVSCISREEAMAEKLRAALSRRDVAIRDFYDIDHAVRKMDLDPRERSFIAMVHRKLSVPGNDPVDVSDSRLAELRLQLVSQLKPVLREQDFQAFDLESVFQEVGAVASLLAKNNSA